MHFIARIASAGSELRRCYDEERALHAHIGVDRSQVTCQEVIEDDVEKASGQDEGPKNHFHEPWAELSSLSFAQNVKLCPASAT